MAKGRVRVFPSLKRDSAIVWTYGRHWRQAEVYQLQSETELQTEAENQGSGNHDAIHVTSF